LPVSHGLSLIARPPVLYLVVVGWNRSAEKKSAEATARIAIGQAEFVATAVVAMP
jgi:hypothetical protein